MTGPMNTALNAEGLPNAECDSVFVYLSNLPDISFEQAAKASGLSSDTADYFAAEDAVLVELRTE